MPKVQICHMKDSLNYVPCAAMVTAVRMKAMIT